MFSDLNIKILIAFNSSLLIECSFYNILPILLYKKKPQLQDYVRDKIVLKSKIRDLNKNISNIKKANRIIKGIKVKIWT